ncbi:MAG: hypothetical protein AAFO79_05440 [Pseudomonadota bacterium]
MLPRLVLILLQAAGGWYGANIAIGYLALSGLPRTAAFVVLIAIIVWLIGVLGAEVLKNTPRPGGATLTITLIFAALFAAIPFIPGLELPGQVRSVVPYLPLIGAVLGYQLKRA